MTAGQFRLRNEADIDAAWDALGAQVERTWPDPGGFVASARSQRGCRAWPRWQLRGLAGHRQLACRRRAVGQRGPGRAVRHRQQAAIGYARREHLQYVGVFALELFCRDGELLANEMAPRVHNSGHWTIEGGETSQFENHLPRRGPALGSTRMLGHACMLNWLGVMPTGTGTGPGQRPLARQREGAARGPARSATPRCATMMPAWPMRWIRLAWNNQAQVAPAVHALRNR